MYKDSEDDYVRKIRESYNAYWDANEKAITESGLTKLSGFSIWFPAYIAGVNYMSEQVHLQIIDAEPRPAAFN